MKWTTDTCRFSPTKNCSRRLVGHRFMFVDLWKDTYFLMHPPKVRDPYVDNLHNINLFLFDFFFLILATYASYHFINVYYTSR